MRSYTEGTAFRYQPMPAEWTIEVSAVSFGLEYLVIVKGPIRMSFRMDAADWYEIRTDCDRMRLANKVIDRVLPRPDDLTVDEWDVLRHHRMALHRQLWRLFEFEWRSRQQRNMGMGWESGLRNGLMIPSHAAENMAAVRRHQSIICAECQAGPLTEFHTSKRDSRTICQACFDKRADKGLAREAGQPLLLSSDVKKNPSQKTRHPLDAWMEDLPQEAP